MEDITCGLDDHGCVTALHSAFYSAQSNDARIVGAILAGMPCSQPKPGYWIATVWPYDKIQTRREEVYGMPNLGADSPTAGLRGLIMRTPGQRQQNFALESLMNEAASCAGIDPIEFRLLHTTDQRLIDIIQATAKAAAWEPRPSPHPGARRNGSAPVTGRGVGIIDPRELLLEGDSRSGSDSASARGPGDEVHHRRELRKDHQPAATGTLHEERRGHGCQRSAQRRGHLRQGKNRQHQLEPLQDPGHGRDAEVKVVQITRNNKGFGGGSEAANAICTPAVAAAFFFRCHRSSHTRQNPPNPQPM